MKIVCLPTLILVFITAYPAYSSNWEFITSATNDQGIEAAYYININDINTYDGIRSYREKRVYTRKRLLESIGVVEVFGYFDCGNRNFMELQFLFLSSDERIVDGYEITGNEKKWERVTRPTTRSKFDFVCRFNNP